MGLGYLIGLRYHFKVPYMGPRYLMGDYFSLRNYAMASSLLAYIFCRNICACHCLTLSGTTDRIHKLGYRQQFGHYVDCCCLFTNKRFCCHCIISIIVIAKTSRAWALISKGYFQALYLRLHSVAFHLKKLEYFKTFITIKVALRG